MASLITGELTQFKTKLLSDIAQELNEMVYYPTNTQAQMLARMANAGKANYKFAGQLNSAGEIIGQTSMGHLCATACEYSYLHYDKNSVGRAGAQMRIHTNLL